MHTWEGRACLDVLQTAGSEVCLTQGFEEGDGTSLAGGAGDVEGPAPWGPISQGTVYGTSTPAIPPSPFPAFGVHTMKVAGGGIPQSPTLILLGAERMGERG